MSSSSAETGTTTKAPTLTKQGFNRIRATGLKVRPANCTLAQETNHLTGMATPKSPQEYTTHSSHAPLPKMSVSF
ncbi:hypothetical protein Pmani_024238 [Petrolisthes manimaculis]|uniref:Uncharacterized protein n=1 Tax=Petrolisthes manimaculis TaxID=1843537 RepID=A0AAE1U2G8_9EUCA|nr:hypothetical protein Pmani_024238 [Petrolisthes manimaculis]